MYLNDFEFIVIPKDKYYEDMFVNNPKFLEVMYKNFKVPTEHFETKSGFKQEIDNTIKDFLRQSKIKSEYEESIRKRLLSERKYDFLPIEREQMIKGKLTDCWLFLDGVTSEKILDRFN